MFAPGTVVRVRAGDPSTHTRVPRYVRGQRGVVVEQVGVHPLPDLVVAAGETRLEPVYAVRFDARALWAEGDHTVTVDLWQSYLEPAL
jgi:Nitrile hydratase beta subunit